MSVCNGPGFEMHRSNCMDRHPARHPLVFITIMALCAVIGIWQGRQEAYFRSAPIAGMIGGGALGLMFGLFIAIIWALLTVLGDL